MLIVLVIFLLLTQNISIQTKFVKVLNCFKNSFSVLHVNTRSIIKNFEALKKFYLKLNCTFSLICFRNMDCRAVGSFFMVGEGGSWERLATMVGRLQKIKKQNTGQNALKKSPKKWALDQIINHSKPHIWNSFLKHYFGQTTFLYSSTHSSWHYQIFF